MKRWKLTRARSGRAYRCGTAVSYHVRHTLHIAAKVGSEPSDSWTWETIKMTISGGRYWKRCGLFAGVLTGELEEM
jgi:hypothetical protein